MPLGRLQEVVIDCADPLRLATFWQRVLGGEIRVESDEWVLVATPDDGASVSFQRVLEPKAGKNRVHLDIRVDISRDDGVDGLALAIERAAELGASRSGPTRLDALGGFQVMLDPEGNEFCLVAGDTPTAV
jgi:predicted enzyme related to lactoylglutathione lyase